MNGEPLSPETIFGEAIDIASADERAAYLDRACENDPELRGAVEQLVVNHFRAGRFLDQPVAQFAATIDSPGEPPIGEKPGTQIGPYKLLQQIGEGGMGTVYMAEQTHPVQRKVALKVIKAGMDSRQVIARFEAERQALAMMDHVNIARVLDAGTTEAGRPYFVMELVKGMPITRFCDEHQLAPRARLELFVPVCQAIQHAHQKGIIHRDIKPSNVMITLYDGKPVPKVIDFGVAKATEQKLTERTLFTQYGTMVGTLEYMSPEQAETSNLGVDTRSDIYSLGVLLYELLTGSTPLTHKRMKEAAYAEVLRMIKEDEPPRPSTRLSDSGEALASISAQRHMEPAKLTKLVRGELDWIVMKTLEKDRNRRYETANGFAADVQRYLNDEAVQACPPSAAYWLRKFVHRHKGLVLASVVVLAALVLGIAGTTIGLLQARAERDKVLAAQEKTLAAQNKERLALTEAEENFQTARDAVDKMYTRAAEEMRDKPQVEQIRRALLEDALRFYQGFLKRKSEDPAVRYEAALSHRRVGEIYGFLGDWKESLENHRRAAAMLTALSPEFANDVSYRDELARAHFHTGCALMALLQLDDGTTSLQEAIALWEPLTSEFPGTPAYLEDLAHANFELGHAWSRNYDSRGDPNVTRGMELLARLKQRFPGHETSSSFKFRLKDLAGGRYGNLPHDTATLKQLEQECRDQLTAAEAEAREHPDAPQYQSQVALWLARLSHVLTAMDRIEELEQVVVRKLEILNRLATQHPETSEHQTALAWAQNDTGLLLHFTDRPDEAVDHFRTAIAIMGGLVDRHPDNLRNLNHLAGLIRNCPAVQVRDPRRALELNLRLKELGGDPACQNLAEAQLDAGQYHEALESCQKASLAGKQTAIITFVTAHAYWHLGRQDEARELVRQVILQLGSQPNQYWWTGQYRWRSREAAKLMGLDVEDLKASDPEKVLRNGIALYHKLAADRPGDPGMLQELARRYTELSLLLSGSGRNEEAEQTIRQAIAEWEKLVAESPGNDDYRMRLGRALWQLADRSSAAGRHDEAEKTLRGALDVFEKLAADFPGNPFCRVEQGYSHWRLGGLMNSVNRPQEAEEAFRQALAVYQQLAADYPQNLEYRLRLSESYNQLAHALVRQGKQAEGALESDKAAAEYAKAIALAPDASEGWTGRAFFHFSRQKWDEAVADFSKAIELAPQVHSNWWHRGHAYLNLAQWDKAAADFGYIIDHWPDGIEGWYLRAVARAHLDQPDKAMADIRQMIANGFNNAEQLKNDSHFAPLRDREDFGKLLEELEQKQKLKNK